MTNRRFVFVDVSEDSSPPPMVVAVCTSPGGIPKWPRDSARVAEAGLEGDGRNHAKHIKPTRAVSLFDEEILLQLREEGYDLQPGSIGENLTIRHLHVQEMEPGTILKIGTARLRLEEPRKPCFVLDAIDPQLKTDIEGRCGYLASVVVGGEITPGMNVRSVEPYVCGSLANNAQPVQASGGSIRSGIPG